MVSARSIFYSVNASSTIIKLAFIPACWLLLISPFILLITRILKIDISPFLLIPEDWRSLEYLPPLVLSFVAVSLSTRFLSGLTSGSSTSDGKTQRVPVAPFWVPWSKHLGQFLLSDKGFLQWARDSTINGAFSYKLAGTTHHVLLSSSLTKAVLLQHESVSAAETDEWIIPQNALGVPESNKADYIKARTALNELFRDLVDQLSNNGGRGQLLRESVTALQDTLPDLITFNTSIVDQMPWERVSDLDLLENMKGDATETNLLSLINEFLSPVLLTPITGAAFPESYQLLFVDLSIFSTNFFALSTGLPRFFPFPGLTPAHLSRNRLLQALTILHESISTDGASTPADAETPTPLSHIDGLMSTYNMPHSTRASATLGFLNQLVSATIPLAFWTILRIHSHDSPTLLPDLLAETKSYAKATQPPPLHPSFPSPTNLTYITASSTRCPLLTSCVLETLRVYATPSISNVVTRDLSITEAPEDVVGGGTPPTWLLKRGDIIDVGASAWLRNSDPRQHLDAKTWKPERFANLAVELDTAVKELVGEEAGMQLAVEVVLGFVAGFMQLWEVQPKGGEGKKWRIPGVRAGSVMGVPRGDCRVRIVKREIEVEKDRMGE